MTEIAELQMRPEYVLRLKTRSAVGAKLFINQTHHDMISAGTRKQIRNQRPCDRLVKSTTIIPFFVLTQLVIP